MPDQPAADRLARAEDILDRWLDLFDDALREARPDPSRTTELANVFTILKRIHEIRILALKTAQLEAAAHDSAGPAFDPDLFGGDLQDSSE